MALEELSIKKKIIAVTFDILLNNDIEKITIRKIAKAANVAVSAINYHFQTKDNLINIAIKESIGDIIAKVKNNYIEHTGTPLEKLRLALKETCKYIVQMPNISKISILNDYNNGYGEDNIKYSSDVLEYILDEVFDGVTYPKKADIVKKTIAYMIVGSIEFSFFRAKQIFLETGLDFYNEKDRNLLIDNFIDQLIINSVQNE